MLAISRVCVSAFHRFVLLFFFHFFDWCCYRFLCVYCMLCVAWYVRCSKIVCRLFFLLFNSMIIESTVELQATTIKKKRWPVHCAHWACYHHGHWECELVHLHHRGHKCKCILNDKPCSCFFLFCFRSSFFHSFSLFQHSFGPCRSWLKSMCIYLPVLSYMRRAVVTVVFFFFFHTFASNCFHTISSLSHSCVLSDF